MYLVPHFAFLSISICINILQGWLNSPEEEGEGGSCVFILLILPYLPSQTAGYQWFASSFGKRSCTRDSVEQGKKNCPGCWNWRLRVSAFLEMSYAELQLQQGNCVALLHPWSDLFKMSTLYLLNTGSTSNCYYKTLSVLTIAWVLQYRFQDHCYMTVQLMLLASCTGNCYGKLYLLSFPVFFSSLRTGIKGMASVQGTQLENHFKPYYPKLEKSWLVVRNTDI